ncbi:transporter [Alteromonadaceae bacterium M269]|nr:transporter [Alteromonadaceae bacterium M269]
MVKSVSRVLALLFAGALSACSVVKQVVIPEQTIAVKVSPTESFKELKSLPKPKGVIPVSVYSFRDQTGQYKPQANVSSFSTAVTQGATSILMQALSDSDWFLPVEREGLQNILTERKIIRAAMQNDKEQGKEANELPPLTTSKLLIEGGIISYDSNVKTGGFGAEYFGIGASELYREDLISIYMRAVDVRSGQVLVSVSTSKKVLSKELRAGFFRYVSFKRLAEAEGGYTTNEPMHICVQQTIEKAVTELIKKGLEKKVWRTQT